MHHGKVIQDFTQSFQRAGGEYKATRRAILRFSASFTRAVVRLGVRHVVKKIFRNVAPMTERLAIEYRKETGKRPPGSTRTARLRRKRTKALWKWAETARPELVASAIQSPQAITTGD